MLITRGERGICIVESGGRTQHLAAEVREVFDVTGAGDTVIATLAAALSAGVGLAEALKNDRELFSDEELDGMEPVIKIAAE